ncbi:unnamed protein product [Natator depressus]
MSISTQFSGCQRRHHQNYESLLLQVTPSSADGREGIRARQEELLSSLLAFEDPDLRKINVPQFTGDVTDSFCHSAVAQAALVPLNVTADPWRALPCLLA